MAELDLLLRGAVIGMVLLVFAVLILRRETRRKSLSVGALAITLSAHMGMSAACGAAQGWAECGIGLVPARLLPLAVTWVVLDIFLEPRESWPRAVFLAAGAVVSALWIATPHQAGLCTISAIALYSGLLGLALWSARGDLVESRRTFRPIFVAAIALFGVTRTLYDTLSGGAPIPGWHSIGFAAVFLALALVFALWALSPGRDLWAEETPKPVATANGLSPADRLTLTRIRTAMQGEIWRREGLTIGAMAQELDIPEHRLRRAINRDLGYRNFPAFVNGYRIEAAKAALGAPENAQRTILEIAYDVGFASLGPFNKAFRALTGTSPRDYRRSVARNASIAA